MPMPHQGPKRSSRLCVWEINKNNTLFAISSTTTNNNCALLYASSSCGSVWQLLQSHFHSWFHKCCYSLWNMETQVIMITIQESSLNASDASSVKLLIQCETSQKWITWSLEENGVKTNIPNNNCKIHMKTHLSSNYEHTFTQFLQRVNKEKWVSTSVTYFFTHVSFYDSFQTIQCHMLSALWNDKLARLCKEEMGPKSRYEPTIHLEELSKPIKTSVMMAYFPVKIWSGPLQNHVTGATTEPTCLSSKMLQIYQVTECGPSGSSSENSSVSCC